MTRTRASLGVRVVTVVVAVAAVAASAPGAPVAGAREGGRADVATLLATARSLTSSHRQATERVAALDAAFPGVGDALRGRVSDEYRRRAHDLEARIGAAAHQISDAAVAGDEAALRQVGAWFDVADGDGRAAAPGTLMIETVPMPAMPVAEAEPGHDSHAADGTDGPLPSVGGPFRNGRAPVGELCRLSDGSRARAGDYPGALLRCDAAAAFVRMNAAYRDTFGHGIPRYGGYRTLAQQVSLRNANCSGPRSNGVWDNPPCRPPTATPGTSNHGWAVAVDMTTPACGTSNACGFATPHYAWLWQNAPRFGFTHPAWAQRGSRSAEYWHWEFTR